MNTNSLKSFARRARITLLEETSRRLIYWGFNSDGKRIEELKATPGGYIFRGAVHDDVSVSEKWNRLKDKVADSKQGFLDVAEEAAYTWFNRLMAIKILEENHFIDPVLTFAKGTKIPMILQNAKAGNHSVTHPGIQSNLQEALLNDEDDKALGILLINYCNQHPLLQKVFGKLNDYTELLVPQNLLSADGFLENLNDSQHIETEDYQHVELIGWLYQFYISDRKDEVFKGFKKKKKARAEDIPAATQIFTPRWIVDYMVENTVGKIYLDYEEDSDLKAEMKYLVTSDEMENKPNKELIDDITELTLIDPACGSGHILVRGFEWLYKMYREQGYNPQQAVEYILKENLYGLDIDDRAMQLARFAVLLKASQKLKADFPGRGKALIEDPQDLIPHIYAFPESRNFVSAEIAQFTGNKNVAEISKAFEELQQGKNLGAALKLELSDQAIEILKTQYQTWKTKANKGQLDLQEMAIWQKIKEYAEVALTLTQQYTAVVANPPYMKSANMNADLKKYVNKHYKLTKSDLFAVFMEVGLNLSLKQGLMGMINQHSWMFLSSYEKYRNEVLQNYSLQNMLHLGPRTFEELSGEVVQSTAFVIQKSKPKNAKANYYRLVDYRNNKEKEENFLAGNNFYPNIPQSNFEKIPGSPIAYWASNEVIEVYNNSKLLEDLYNPRQGMATTNNKYFLKFWHEISNRKIGFNLKRENYQDSDKKWFPYLKGGGFRKHYGNHEYVVNYEDNGKELKEVVKEKYRDAPYAQGFSDERWDKLIEVWVLKNQQFYFKNCISWSFVSSGAFGVRSSEDGFIFDVGGSALFPKREIKYYVASFLNSNVALYFLNLLNPTLNYQVGNIKKLPLITEESKELKTIYSTNVSLSKKDWDSRETSWDFEENPLIKQQAATLKEAYQNWKEEVSQDFLQLHENEEELNRIFIDIYGLQEELSPEVALKDITILQDEIKNKDLEELEEEFRQNGSIDLPIQQEVVIQQFLSYLIGLMLGRYRLDKPGLHIAHPKPSEEEIAPYPVDNVAEPFTFHIEKDAILPIMGEDSAFPNDASQRIKDLVYHIWGDDTHSQNLNFIEECLGMSIEKWVSEKFWKYHFSGEMYKKKPIYWLFASNPKQPHRSAFKVLVYMHRMDAFSIQKILRNYLYPQQQHLNNLADSLQDREAELNKDEAKQLENLRNQLRELKDYEQVLKGFANQQITFDLDDGVDENIKLFEGIVAELK